MLRQDSHVNTKEEAEMDPLSKAQGHAVFCVFTGV